MQLSEAPFWNGIQNGCILLTLTGKIIEVNQAAEQLLHRNRLALLDKSVMAAFSMSEAKWKLLCSKAKARLPLSFYIEQLPNCCTLQKVQSNYLLSIQPELKVEEPLVEVSRWELQPFLTRRVLSEGGLRPALGYLQNWLGCTSIFLCTFSLGSLTVQTGTSRLNVKEKEHIIAPNEILSRALQSASPCLFTRADFNEAETTAELLKAYDIDSVFLVPFQKAGFVCGALLFASNQADFFSALKNRQRALLVTKNWSIPLYDKLFWGKSCHKKDVETDQRATYIEKTIGGKTAFSLKQQKKFAERSFYKAFHTNPCLMMLSDMAGCVLLLNQSFLRTTGFEKRDIIGKQIEKIGLCSSESLEFLKTSLTVNHKINQQEIIFFTKQGEARQGIIEADFVRVDGKEVLLIQIIDTTEQKRMEQELCRLDSLSIVGQMAAGISHEVRNPMTTVRGFLQMLMRKPDCQKYKGFYELMILELDRANSLISEFLVVARNKPVDMARQNLNDIIHAVEPLIYAQALSLGKNLHVLLGEIPPIYVNGKEIRQLLLNLVGNALDAMDKGQTVTIKTNVLNQRVQLMVADQGKGIDQNHLYKLGTPFFTTKEKGTGLGLAVCFQIIERHRAVISVDTCSEGTVFTISFPIEKPLAHSESTPE